MKAQVEQNKKILETLKPEIIEHIEKNFSLMLEDDATIKQDYTTDEIRRLCYSFQVTTDSGIKYIAYDFRVSIGDGR